MMVADAIAAVFLYFAHAGRRGWAAFVSPVAEQLLLHGGLLGTLTIASLPGLTYGGLICWAIRRASCRSSQHESRKSRLVCGWQRRPCVRLDVDSPAHMNNACGQTATSIHDSAAMPLFSHAPPISRRTGIRRRGLAGREARSRGADSIVSGTHRRSAMRRRNSADLSRQISTSLSRRFTPRLGRDMKINGIA